MKVIKRSQITEIITERIVSHTVELNKELYERIQKIKITIPYMDCNIDITNPKIEWRFYIGEKTVRPLSKKEVKELKLNEQFDELNINDVNGNG